MKKVVVLGSENCVTCTNLKDKIAKMVSDKNIPAEVSKVTDIVEVMKYGVMSVPGLVIDGQVKCSGRIPSDKELNSWLA